MAIAEVAAGRQWHLLDDDVVVGRAHVLHRPDGRAFVAVDAWHADRGAELLEAVLHAVPGDLFSLADEKDHVQLALLGLTGFVEARREDELLVPVRAAAPVAVPGLTVVSAADAELDRLARLDERLRRDVPGSAGWVNDLDSFRANTLETRMYDPATHLVAVDDRTGAYAGLVRVGVVPGRARLGMVGVLPAYRRRGLATQLLARAFRAVAGRGIEHATAEADTTDTAAQALLRRFGARRTGGTVELVRRAVRPVA